MTQNEKFQVQRRNTLRNLWQKLSGTPEFPVKLVLAALYLMGAAYVCVKQAAWRTLAGNIPLISPLLKAAMEHALTAYLLAGAAVLLALLLYPFGRRAAKDQLQCIGLVNHAGMPPDLLRKRREKDNPRVTIWEFRNNSIPLQEWENSWGERMKSRHIPRPRAGARNRPCPDSRLTALPFYTTTCFITPAKGIPSPLRTF